MDQFGRHDPNPRGAPTGAVASELADLLAQEATRLEVLLFRLIELRHLLVAGEGRFLAWAAEDVAHSARAVRDLELRRALLVNEVAAARGLPDEALTLSALAEAAPSPWSLILSEHRDTLRTLLAEVDRQASAVRRLASAGAATVAAALDELFPPPQRPSDGMPGTTGGGS